MRAVQLRTCYEWSKNIQNILYWMKHQMKNRNSFIYIHSNYIYIEALYLPNEMATWAKVYLSQIFMHHVFYSNIILKLRILEKYEK